MILASVDPEALAISIPIIAIMGGIAVAITAVITKGKTKELLHRERIVAMEKGIEIPTEPEIIHKPVYSSRRAGGLVLTAIGIAVTIGIWSEDGLRSGVWGLIPMFIGISLLIAATLDKREYERDRDLLVRAREMRAPSQTMTNYDRPND